ncbi:type VII secretion protein EccB [Actinoplanes sp. NPDC051851]|uniref:type VII secretion protein EccB n=1 Tax=Actinoplanes sp. NPDC051851 TaxID=3154753 RepID=UPI00341E6CE6
MTSRRDQLQSYQFMNQRVISAFVMRETDPAQSPLRRGVGALFGGLMLAVLIGAGFGIHGLLTGAGTDDWKSEGSVVIERESGAAFVYLQGRLNPALNLASAKLAAGRPDPTVYRIAASSLAGAPRGVTIGIAGAPASLPAADRRVGLPWSMCVAPGDDPVSTLLVGTAATGGTALGEGGLLVTDPAGGDTQLIWHGFKHDLADARTTVPALYGAVTAIPVGTAWLNTIPAGADIAAPRVTGRGDVSGAVGRFRNGDVLSVETGSGTQFYLVLDDGVLPITPVQRRVLYAAFPASPITVPVAEVTGFPQLTADADTTAKQAPADPPKLATVGSGETVCAITRDAAAAPSILVGGPAAGLADAVPTTGATSEGRALADAVQVPAGRFALVRIPGSAGYALVTDVGLRFAVPDADALSRLGYSAGTATAVPTALLGALPAGATLDPAAAARAVNP